MSYRQRGDVGHRSNHVRNLASGVNSAPEGALSQQVRMKPRFGRRIGAGGRILAASVRNLTPGVAPTPKGAFHQDDPHMKEPSGVMVTPEGSEAHLREKPYRSCSA